MNRRVSGKWNQEETKQGTKKSKVNIIRITGTVVQCTVVTRFFIRLEQLNQELTEQVNL